MNITHVRVNAWLSYAVCSMAAAATWSSNNPTALGAFACRDDGTRAAQLAIVERPRLPLEALHALRSTSSRWTSMTPSMS